MPSWQQIGPHRYYTSGSFLHWEPHGPILIEHVPPFVAVLDGMGAGSVPIRILIDQRDAQPFGPAPRRLVLDYIRKARPDAFVAFVGSRLPQRAVNQLLIGAARMLFGYELRHAHFDTVEQAQRHLQSLA
jgi:hypothetical protein